MVADFWQRGVVQLCEQAGPSLELLSQGVVGDGGLFKGNGSAEPLVRRLVNRPHPTLTEVPDNAVAIL
jgi:hypothetical protein